MIRTSLRKIVPAGLVRSVRRTVTDPAPVAGMESELAELRRRVDALEDDAAARRSEIAAAVDHFDRNLHAIEVQLGGEPEAT